MYSAVTGCTRPVAKFEGNAAAGMPPGGQVSMIGILLAPGAADAATRKYAGLSVAIGRVGWELVDVTCHRTGALAG